MLNFLDVFHSGEHHGVLHSAEGAVGCHQIPAFEKTGEPDNDCSVCLIQSSLFAYLSITVLNIAFFRSYFIPDFLNASIYKISCLLTSDRAPPLGFAL